MAISETARLIASLELKDLFTKSVDNATKSMAKLDKSITSTQGRAFKAGQQIGVGIKRGVIIATTALTGLAGLLLLSAKEGQQAANVQLILGNAIAKSGKVSAGQVVALKAQADALLGLSGVDDELIKSEQTRLIQMGLTGAQVLKLTPAILDLSKATGRDLLTSTLAAGKAAEGSATGLQRFGVFVDKAKFKLDPFGATLDAINKKFGGTTAALSGQLDTKLSVFNERLKNIREEAGIKLLPALTRIVDTVTKSLLPAFQSFIDSILPSVITGLNKFADFLQSGQGAKSLTSVFNTIKAAAPIIQKSAEATFTIVKAAVDLFTSLPEGLQQLAVGAFAVNKLTGGLVTNVGGGIADFIAGKIGLLRGQTPATPLFVSDVTGGLGSAAGAAGAAGGGIRALAGGVLALFSVGALEIAAAGWAHDFLLANGIDLSKPVAQIGPVQIGGQTDAQRLRAAADAAQHPGGLANPILDRGGREKGTAGLFGTITGTIRKAIAAGIMAVQRGFSDMIKALRTARTDPAIRKAAQEAIHQIAQLHRGNLDGTSRTIAALKTALKNVHDPKLRKELQADLAKVQSFLPGRQFAAKQLGKADALIKDGKITRGDLKAIQKIERDLKDRGLPHAADVIKKKVQAAQDAQVKATNNVAAQVKDQKVNVDVAGQIGVTLRSLYQVAGTALNLHVNVTGQSTRQQRAI